MSPDRATRLVLTGVAAGALWLTLALSVSAEDPSGSPSVSGEPQPSGQPTAPAGSADPGVTPSPSDTDWLFATPVPTPGVPLVPAPPVPSPIVYPASAEGHNGCADCHGAVNEKQAEITGQWSTSAHAQAGVTCADCHGGDPGTDQITKAMDPANGFVGSPDRAGSVGLCGSCHANVDKMRTSDLPTDQYAKYWSSVHGQLLAADNDARVAVCIDCHGSHDVKKVSDPAARVFATNVPELCSSCHSDPKRMEPYGIPTDQLDVYKESVHGKALLENNDARAPSCASCHGSHDAQPPTSTTVVEVCGKCHTATQELFEQSRHSELAAAAPKCWTCHGTHDVSQPSSELFFHPEAPDYACNTCHDLSTRTLRLELDRFSNEADRRCDTCHHPDSQIYSQIEGIYEAVTSAEKSYADAEARIAEAARLGMITEDAEVRLTDARTSLIQAQAAVHTTKLKQISELSADARTKAEEALGMATAQVDESWFRRQAMIIVLGLIFVSVAFLVVLKLRLDRELEAEHGAETPPDPDAS